LPSMREKIGTLAECIVRAIVAPWNFAQG
jgi:hypothetical protein